MTHIPFSIAGPGAASGRLATYPRRDVTPQSLRPPKPSFLVRLVAALRELRRRQRSRRDLSRFDAAMLKDIGLTRTDAEIEINKPLWRV